MGRGRLIVLEGIDGAGTTTQAALLAEALVGLGVPTHTTREPSDGPVGVLIRQILTGRVVVQGHGGPREPCMESMALLFAADRIDHLEAEILPNLAEGVTVICDRYVHSSIAYQTLTASEPGDRALEWVKTVNSRARVPDLVIVLDVPANEAARRRRARSGRAEMYETDELQRRLAAFYADLPRRFSDQAIVVVDGARPIEAVHDDCLKAARRLILEGA